jgi:chemotaxis response regulator CheB
VDTVGIPTDPLRPAVELVAVLASAGGLDSLSVVLGDLSAEFPAAVVVQQHLGGHSSVLSMILGERTPHRVDWARDGQISAFVAGEVEAAGIPQIAQQSVEGLVGGAGGAVHGGSVRRALAEGLEHYPRR